MSEHTSKPGVFARVARAWEALRGGFIMSNDPALSQWFGFQPSATGVSVNADTALNVAAVWSAVNLIASQVAQLPLKLYRVDTNGAKFENRGNPLYTLLHDEVSPESTSFCFRETLT